MPRRLWNDPIRGKPVKITTGKYYVNDGAWINEAEGDKGFTECTVYLIIERQGMPVKLTNLNKKYLDLNPKPKKKPTVYDEAVLDQHPKLLLEMQKLCNKIAKHRPREAAVYAVVFDQMLILTCKRHRDNDQYITVWQDDTDEKMNGVTGGVNV